MSHANLMHSRERLHARRERALGRRENDVIRWGKLMSEAEGDAYNAKLERAKTDVANLKRKLRLQT